MTLTPEESELIKKLEDRIGHNMGRIFDDAPSLQVAKVEAELFLVIQICKRLAVDARKFEQLRCMFVMIEEKK